MALTYYGTPEQVRAYTGIRPEDLGLSDITGGDTADQQLAAILVTWLGQATDIMDYIIGGSYLDDQTVPAGLHNIAVRIVANMIAQAVLRRETPVIRIGEYAVRMTDDTIITPSIRRDLMRYRRAQPFRMFVPRMEE